MDGDVQGSWAGEGVVQRKRKKRPPPPRIQQPKRPALQPASRKDEKLKHVIINEKRDKKVLKIW